MCKEPGIANPVDKHTPGISDEWNMSHDKAVIAMIINGFWFYGQSLHRFPRFFDNNPLGKLIRNKIEPEHINDNALRRSLGELFDPDISKVYFEQAIKVLRHLEEVPPYYHPCGTVSSRCVGRRAMSFLSINFHVNSARYQQSGYPPLPFVNVSCCSSCLHGRYLCVFSGCFSG